MRGPRWRERLIVAATVAMAAVVPSSAQVSGSWIQTTPRDTPLREQAAAYDAVRNRMIVFGGFDERFAPGGAYTNEMWSFGLPPSAPQWTQLTSGPCSAWPAPPPLPRGRSGMVTDNDPMVAHDRMMIWGGAIPQQDYLTWTLDFTSGTPSQYLCSLGTTGDPSPFPDTRSVLDSRLQRMIVVAPYQGVYALSLRNGGSSWTQIYAGPVAPSFIGAFGFHAVYDSTYDRVLIFGGWTDEVGNYCGQEYRHDEVFALSLQNPTGWVQVGAAAAADVGQVALSDAAVVYDPDSRRILMFGGERCRRTDTGTEVHGDVWALPLPSATGMSTWTQMTIHGQKPAARFYHSAIWDNANHQMVIFGGTANLTTNFRDTWSLVPDSVDVIPPSAVTTLYVDNVGPNQAQLVWTAPGDDGNVGTASLYDVYYRPRTLTTCNSGGINAIGEPAPQVAGTPQGMIIKKLLPCTWYCFSMWTEDEVGNRSELSNFAQAKTTCQGH